MPRPKTENAVDSSCKNRIRPPVLVQTGPKEQVQTGVEQVLQHGHDQLGLGQLGILRQLGVFMMLVFMLVLAAW